jgi:hypothetical protein
VNDDEDIWSEAHRQHETEQAYWRKNFEPLEADVYILSLGEFALYCRDRREPYLRCQGGPAIHFTAPLTDRPELAAPWRAALEEWLSTHQLRKDSDWNDRALRLAAENALRLLAGTTVVEPPRVGPPEEHGIMPCPSEES